MKSILGVIFAAALLVGCISTVTTTTVVVVVVKKSTCQPTANPDEMICKATPASESQIASYSGK